MALSERNEAMYGTNVANDVVAEQKIRQEHVICLLYITINKTRTQLCNMPINNIIMVFLFQLFNTIYFTKCHNCTIILRKLKWAY